LNAFVETLAGDAPFRGNDVPEDLLEGGVGQGAQGGQDVQGGAASGHGSQPAFHQQDGRDHPLVDPVGRFGRAHDRDVFLQVALGPLDGLGVLNWS